MSLNRPSPDPESQLDTARMRKWIANGDGPIQAAWPVTEYSTIVQQIAPETAKNLGIKSQDAEITDSTGFYDQALAIDMKSGRRSSSVYGYYLPNAHRKNLSLIMDAMVHRIVFSDEDSNKDKTATGVEFVVDGQTYTASAKKEVILCAGTVQSPQILELSGIGSKSILEREGIKVVVDNPGVGENLQDHVMTGIGYEVVSGVPTFEDFKKPGVMEALIAEYMKNPVGPLVNQLTSSIYLSYSDLLDDKSQLQQAVESLIPESETTGNTALAKQLKIHRDRLLNPADCVAWLVLFAGGGDFSQVHRGPGLFDHSDPGNYLNCSVGLTHPLSRGASHIQSSDVNTHPLMDPRYLSHPADIDILAHAVRFIDTKVVHAEPLASKIKDGLNGRKLTMPTFKDFLPKNAEGFVKNNVSTQWHILGTCSMLPRKDGGVVDPKLKVYGTANVRVVDASIIPFEIQGNIQTAVYAVAEKGADLIKATW